MRRPRHDAIMHDTTFSSIDTVQAALIDRRYITERSLATAIFLSVRMGKPLFLEGEAGVGKTEIAKVLASLLDTPLIRMQCYEGLDAAAALYEWNYAGQLLHLRLLEASGAAAEQMRGALYTREFLHARPLLRAIEDSAVGRPPVLLIDELDRADEEFEAFLLELLSDFQVTIPELGTIRAAQPPVVIITSNRTREIHDALKRRCLYYWIDYPSFEKELAIVRAKAPHIEDKLARWITAFVQELRKLDLFKAPGVAETLDWVTALVALEHRALSPDIVSDTVGVILKYQDDIAAVNHVGASVILERARVTAEIQR
jgi:MoxR-like ATPase